MAPVRDVGPSSLVHVPKRARACVRACVRACARARARARARACACACVCVCVCFFYHPNNPVHGSEGEHDMDVFPWPMARQISTSPVKANGTYPNH